VVRDAIAVAAAAAVPPAVIRVTLRRSGAIETAADPAGSWSNVPAGPAVGLVVADRPVSSENVYLFHQTTNRRFLDALHRANPAADAVVLWNERDEVAGVADAVLAVELDGRWITPPLDAGCQPLTLRSALLETGAVSEELVPVEMLEQAARLAVVDEANGWRPARLLW